MLKSVEDIQAGEYVPYGGVVTEALDGGAQIRLTFNTGADAYFLRGSTLRVEPLRESNGPEGVNDNE